MPTTLFGQKYVALVARSEGGPIGIEDGTVIPQERVHTSVELGAGPVPALPAAARPSAPRT